MSAICIIPARGGSQRIPRKNIKMFHGKPIIAYSIEAAHKTEKFGRVVVTTDDKEIASVAWDYGAQVDLRPPEEAQNEIGTQEVMGKCLQRLDVRDGHACCIYATSPLMSYLDVRYSHADLCQDGIDYVFSVTTAGTCVADAGQWYWGEVDAFIRRRPLIGGRTRMRRIPDKRFCDINTPEDWARAEQMYAAL